MQDVARKIMSFAQGHGSPVVYVMSTSGAICNVTLRQQSISGGTITYQVAYTCMPVILYILSEQLEHNLTLYDKRLTVKSLLWNKNLVFVFYKFGV